MILVLAGGVGAARFLRGLVRTVDPAEITVVVNTGDDTRLHGLYISPDIDTVTYTVAGAIDPERGWGLAEESWRAMEALERYGSVRPPESSAGATWFNLGDRDLATHFYRTARLAEGATLSRVTAEIAEAWHVPIRIKPMSDDPVVTMVDVIEPGGTRTVSFQEYFVRLKHAVPIAGVSFVGSDEAQPTFLADIEHADAIIIAPSNPIVSLGPIRSLPGVDAALRRNRDRVVAISPIVAGAALKGPADRMLRELGREPTVVGVAELYADIASALIIDDADAESRPDVEERGLRCVATDTIMRDVDVAARLARTAIDALRTGDRT